MKLSYIAGRSARVQPLEKVCRFLINIHLSYDSAILYLNIYPREVKAFFHKETQMQMFIAVLFVIAKNWTYPQQQIDEKIIAYLWNGILFIIKKKQTIDTCNMDESQKHYAVWKEPETRSIV